MRATSLNIGSSAPLEVNGATVRSAIAKKPVSSPLWLGLRGFAEDEQADTRHHGSPDQALCVYPGEHYSVWEARLGRSLAAAAFGENVTAAGWLETDACPGDTLRLGGALVQISGGRVPCAKVGARNGAPPLTAWLRDSCLTGFYLRVLEPGMVAPGDAIELIEREAEPVTIFELNRLVYVDTHDIAAAERALAAGGVTDWWRTRLQRNIAADRSGSARAR